MTKKKSPHFSILLNSKKVDKKINLVSRSLSELLGDMVRLREDNPLSYRSFEIERTPFDLRLFFLRGGTYTFFYKGINYFFCGGYFLFLQHTQHSLAPPQIPIRPQGPLKGHHPPHMRT